MRKISIFFISSLALLFVQGVYAQATTTESIPLGLAQRVSNTYTWALGIGGMVALGIIIFGGVLYSASGGNPSRMDEAKKWIQHALFGLALLFSSYILLNFINPDLTRLEEIFLEPNPQVQGPTLERLPYVSALGDILGNLGSLLSGDSQELATALLERAANPENYVIGDGQLTFYHIQAKTHTLEPVSGGMLATVNSDNTIIKRTTVSPALLRLVLTALESGHSINSGTITTSQHSSNSEHYLGRAIDIITVPPTTSISDKEELY